MKKQPELVFGILIFIIGSILILITPAGANYDEETYVARIWEMGLGYFIPNEHLSEGGNFPGAFLDISYRRQNNVPVINTDILKEQLKVKVDWQHFVEYETRAGYFPTLFILPAALMRLFGAHFQLPVLIIYFLLRFSYLLIFCLLLYLTVKVLPFGKRLFGILSLAPMCLIQATSISADPIVFGVAFLFIAWILKLGVSPNEAITKKEALYTCLLILAIGTLKPNMIFFLPILFVIPFRKYAMNKAWIAVIISVVVSLLLTFGWMFITSQLFNNSREYEGIYPTARLLSIFTNPLEFLRNLSITLSERSLVFFKQLIGVSGYGYWLMPEFVYWLFPIVVVLSLFSETQSIKLSIKQRLIIGLIGIFNIFFIFIYFYIGDTPIGYNGIWGIQGRYFVPFIPLLLVPFLYKNRFRFPFTITGILTGIIVISSVGTLFLDFHAICGSTWFNNRTCSYPYYKNWDPSTFISIKMDNQTTIEQNLVVECNKLSQIQIWVNQYEPIKNKEEFLVLETIDGTPLRKIRIDSAEIPKAGWLIIDLQPVLNQRNNELNFKITSNGKGGIPELELARFPSFQYSRGGMKLNGQSLEQNLVFQYNCLDGFSNLWY